MTQTIESPAVNVQSLLAELHQLSGHIDELNAELARCNKRWAVIEQSLLDFSNANGIDSFRGAGITVSFDTSAFRATYAPERWVDVVRWAVASGNEHIVQRRLTDKKVIDLVDAGIALPEGLNLEQFTKISVKRT